MMTKAWLTLGLGLALAGALAQPARAWPTGNNPADVNLLVTYAGGLSVVVDSAAVNTYVMLASNTALHMWENPGQSAFAVPSTSITVVNNGNLTEKWELDASTTSGLGNWTLHNSSGPTRVNGINPVNEYGCTLNCPVANEYGVQALFVSSNTTGGIYGNNNACPAVNATVWDAVLDTVPVKQGWTPGTGEAAGVAIYTSAYFANNAVVSGASGNPDVIAGVSNGDMYSYYAVAGSGEGQRGLCLRVTMPNTATTQSQQTITVEITAIPGT
jgi:hypothetical protein